MSANCLVKKIEGATNNYDLQVLDAININVKKVANMYCKLAVKANSEVEIQAYGKGRFGTSVANITDNPLTMISGTDITVYMPCEDYNVVVRNKKALTSFIFEQCNSSGARPSTTVRQNNIDLAQLQDVTLMTDLYLLATAYGDLSYIKGISKLNVLYLVSNADFENANLTNIPVGARTLYLQNSNISGTMSDLGDSNATTIYNTKVGIRGTIEDLARQRLLRERSGTTNLYYFTDGSITFGNYTINKSPVHVVISLDGKIRVEYRNTPKIMWCKGYSAEEIASYEQQGYTVNVVSEE